MPLIKITGTPQEYSEQMMKKGGHWIQGAIKHPGRCTPLSKPGCTGHARALALMFKKKHGFHKKKQEGGFAQDFTGLGTYLHDGPVEMQLEGTNPIVGGPKDVMAMDEGGQMAHIPAYSPYPVYMNGKVKEVPLMEAGGPIGLWKNRPVGYYNPHRGAYDYYTVSINPSYDEQISGHVKPVDRDQANIEAEEGELKLKPDMMGLHKIGGKPHSEGGTPLYAEGGSFIFSDDKDLSIGKPEREAFKFKSFKSNAAAKNTPAKVLEREVNPKEYNRFLNILQDDNYDNISKDTAALMLAKMQAKIGQVAYLQESKKNAQIPDFAMGTAPMTSPDIQKQEMESKMYQAGGSFNPQSLYYLSKNYKGDPSIGDGYPDIYPGGKTNQGRYTPTGYNNQYDYPMGDPKETNSAYLTNQWKRYGVDLMGKNPGEAQGAMYDWAMKNNPDLLRDVWSQFGMTAKGNNLKGFDLNNLSDSDLNKLRGSYTDNMLGVRAFSPSKGLTPYGNMPSVAPMGNTSGPFNITPPTQHPAGSNYSTNPTLPYDIQGQLNSAQMSHLGALGLQALSVKKYYPKREQINLPDVKLNTINSQPYLNAINNQSQQAYQASRLNSPQEANGMASNIYGKSLDSMSQTLGNISNQNSQIQNQENLTNLQQRTNQVGQNAQLDSRYYDQTQAVRQNYDNEKRFASNQFLGTMNQYQSQADQLAWTLASINKYGTRQVVDPKTGRTYNQPVPLYEYTGNGIKYNADVANMNMATGADRVNSVQEAKQILQQFNINPGDPKSVYSISRLLDAISSRGRQPLYNENPYLQR